MNRMNGDRWLGGCVKCLFLVVDSIDGEGLAGEESVVEDVGRSRTC